MIAEVVAAPSCCDVVFVMFVAALLIVLPFARVGELGQTSAASH